MIIGVNAEFRRGHVHTNLNYTRNQVKGTRQRQKVQQKCSDPCPPKKASITPKIKFVTHKTRYYEVTRGLDLPESCKFSLLGRETCRRCNLPLKLWQCMQFLKLLKFEGGLTWHEIRLVLEVNQMSKYIKGKMSLLALG